jgi:hypothetical protein
MPNSKKLLTKKIFTQMKKEKQNIEVDHYTHESGNSIIRNTKDINYLIKDSFKSFHNLTNSKRIPIEFTKITAQVENHNDFVVFKLYDRNNKLMTINVCCFGENIPEFFEYIKNLAGAKNLRSIPRVFRSPFILYTFIELQISPVLADYLKAGEVEFYIYDALFKAYNKIENRFKAKRKKIAKANT